MKTRTHNRLRWKATKWRKRVEEVQDRLNWAIFDRDYARDRLADVIARHNLFACPNCDHISQKGWICDDCGFDPSVPE